MTQTTDHLGYDAYANSLWARIEAALNKDVGDKELGDDPLVVGIFGEWGAGKSMLLKQIYALAQKQSNLDIAKRSFETAGDIPLSITVPVFFQPWKYEHEPHLHVPIAMHIADAVNAAWKDLPVGWEAVDKLLKDGLVTIEGAADKLGAAKTTFGKLQKGWNNAKQLVNSKAAAVVASAADAGLMMAGAPPVIGLARKKFQEYTAPSDEDTDEDSSEVANTKSAAITQAKAPVPASSASSFAHKDDGLGFYRTDRILRALTRPYKNKKQLAAARQAIGTDIHYELKINIVVFVDDLDRCLPEMAVKTLELIKTVFSLESFAFVLALDEEVIERGIGHRYKDYELLDKKPKMPITGFEYLEKIVHVPFRLPALSVHQARDFLSYYELTIETDPSKCWFQPIKSVENGGSSNDDVHKGAGRLEAHVDFTDLALCAFDAYVPRKLIRLVELLHQTAAIARDERKRPMPRYLSEKIDSRVLFALILIQLFQPELFRIMRRRLTAFPFLLEAFTPTAATTTTAAATTATSAGFTNPDLSNSDLWNWAIGTSPQSALPAGHSTVVGALNPYEAALQQMALIQNDTERYKAQQVRLPTAVQLLEHRAVQRHTFDVLKLMLKLRRDGVATGLDMRDYFGFLAQQPALPSTITTPIASTAPDTRTKFALANVQRVFDLWTSTSDADIASLANDFVEGQAITSDSASSLLKLATEWLKTQPNESQAKQAQLLKGFERLAPALAKEDRLQFWQLVEALNPIPTKPNDITPNPKLADLYADVRYLLGQDDRFEPTRFYLPKGKWNKNSEQQEPIDGFVRVEDAQPFYMARTLTTVDQYAGFINAGGYEDEKLLNTLWDKQGLAWLDGEDGKGTEDWYKRITEMRPKALRKRPFSWDEQQAIGVRPVWGVTWFEARAYARWLNLQLGGEIGQHPTLNGYEITLPTEAHWQRAAKQGSPQAKTDKASGLPTYPWGDDDGTPELRANIKKSESESEIGHASAVGVFAPNSLGLLDLSGNVWEWQNNLYKGSKDTFESLAKDRNLVSKAKWEDSDLVALRGGSWIFIPEGARCSYRGGDQPGHWNGSIGFRVMMSLANDPPVSSR